LANPSKPYNGTQLDTMCNLEYQSCRDQSKDLNYFCGLMQSNAVFNTRSNLNEGFLDFRIEALEKAQIVFLALPTPPGEDGSADLSYVLNAAAEIGKLMTDYKVLVDKSTGPVGTAEKVAEAAPETTEKVAEEEGEGLTKEAADAALEKAIEALSDADAERLESLGEVLDHFGRELLAASRVDALADHAEGFVEADDDLAGGRGDDRAPRERAARATPCGLGTGLGPGAPAAAVSLRGRRRRHDR
jgi:hypothetical protein